MQNLPKLSHPVGLTGTSTLASPLEPVSVAIGIIIAILPT